MKSEDLVAVIDFIYCGEGLDSFLLIAEELQLKGLMGTVNNKEVDQKEALKETIVKVFKTHVGEKSNKCNQCDYASSPRSIVLLFPQAPVD